jgi:hypothetical protein
MPPGWEKSRKETKEDNYSYSSQLKFDATKPLQEQIYLSASKPDVFHKPERRRWPAGS